MGLDGKAAQDGIRLYSRLLQEPPPVVNVINIGGSVVGSASRKGDSLSTEPDPLFFPKLSPLFQPFHKESKMDKFIHTLRSFIRDEEGAQVIEYALIVAVVSLGLILLIMGATASISGPGSPR
jgi:Flp pilus assembly pilin Flp